MNICSSNEKETSKVLSLYVRYIVAIIHIFSFQAYYNVISYSDQMRLKTAVELLKTTRDIESQVEKVSFLSILDIIEYLAYVFKKK